MAGTKASAKKAWKTRRKRYGKDGRLSSRTELVRTVKSVNAGRRKMLDLAKKRTETKGNAKKKAVTRKVAIVRATTRSRPVRLGYYKGDQVKPLSSSNAGLKQFARTVLLDRPRDGSKYEQWEKSRSKGKDKVIKEWLHVGVKPAKPKRKTKRKMSKGRSKKKLKKMS